MRKHYAISDLHGAYDIYEQVCVKLDPSDTVIFLGDAGDRGYGGWELIKAIYNNPQWIYIKGNHEQLAVNALKEYRDIPPRNVEEAVFHGRYTENYLWEINGGSITFEQFIEDGKDFSWIEKLENLPLIQTYVNKNGDIIHLSHAGFNPDSEEKCRDYLWDRNHFFYNKWSGKDNEYIVHGHTPIDIMLRKMHIHNYEFKPQACMYCDDHKINIDSGTFYTGYSVLLDLDTFDEYPFYDRTGRIEVDLR